MQDHLTITPRILYFGTPVVLIVTCNPDGSPNITPVSSAWALGDCITLGLGAASQGAANLRRDGVCTLNLPSADLWPQVERIARTTGVSPVPDYKRAAGFRHEGDKFALGGFTATPSTRIAPPRIAECPLQFEARMLACHQSAKPGESRPHLLIEVETLRVHARRDIVISGTNHIDTARWNPLFYVFRHYFGDARDLGRNFRAEA